MTAPTILPIPYRDPTVAFAPLADTPMAVLLDSALSSAQGRYSYIAVNPVHVLQCTTYPWRVTRNGAPYSGDPFEALTETLTQRHIDTVSLPVPFGGGAIGWFAYELGGVLERLPPPRDHLLANDMIVGIYETIAAFDHQTGAAWVIAHGDGASRRAENLAARLGNAPLSPEAPAWNAQWRQETDRTGYESNVARTVEFIRAGDIFQANITQRLIAETARDLDWFALYRRLRARTPAPFSAYFRGPDDMRLLSASPERFLAVDRTGHVETRPIKGTRRRDPNAAKDAALARALVASAKDRAENLMIVDLLRNDLARACVPGSIAVPVLQGLESFPTVHHLVSVVTGQLRPGKDAVDLLRACFPGGSVTGAPKIRAMEIIHGLEAGARGPYCGALVWLGFDGAMDSSIVIRSLVGNDRRIYAQAGGGIVADSDPALEYAESLIKVAPLLAALTDQPLGTDGR